MKLYADPTFAESGLPHLPLLYPFWGNLDAVGEQPMGDRFRRYVEAGPHIFELVPFEDAEIVLLPVDWEHVRDDPDFRARAVALAEHATANGLRTLVFYWVDDTDEIPLDGRVVFRTSLYRSQHAVDEFAMPAWSEDIVEHFLDGRVRFRDKRERPVVGFCGHAPEPRARGWNARLQARRAQRERGPRRTLDGTIRAKALTALADSPHVELNAQLRELFWGRDESDGRANLVRMTTERQEYVQNLLDSDYVLCARGGGNFSYRLYETLSVGRIPLFIDTDCVLPFEDQIDWRALTIFVDEGDLESIGEQVRAFHADLSRSAFQELQEECRRVWETFIAPEGFMANLHEVLEQCGAILTP